MANVRTTKVGRQVAVRESPVRATKVSRQVAVKESPVRVTKVSRYVAVPIASETGTGSASVAVGINISGSGGVVGERASGTAAVGIAVTGTGLVTTPIGGVLGVSFGWSLQLTGTIDNSTLKLLCNDPPCGFAQFPYYHIFLAEGGSPPYTFSIVDGHLPSGLVLDPATGEVTGVATGISNPNPPPKVFPEYQFFTIEVLDHAGHIADALCFIIICPGGDIPLSVTCNNPPTACIGVQYDHCENIVGGTPPYVVTVTFPATTEGIDALPPGLSMPNLPTDACITGIPTTEGEYRYTITVEDSDGNMAHTDCTITVCKKCDGGGGGNYPF